MRFYNLFCLSFFSFSYLFVTVIDLLLSLLPIVCDSSKYGKELKKQLTFNSLFCVFLLSPCHFETISMQFQGGFQFEIILKWPKNGMKTKETHGRVKVSGFYFNSFFKCPIQLLHTNSYIYAVTQCHVIKFKAPNYPRSL